MAAGGGDSVLFWDRRKAQPLASFGDTHAQVRLAGWQLHWCWLPCTSSAAAAGCILVASLDDWCQHGFRLAISSRGEGASKPCPSSA